MDYNETIQYLYSRFPMFSKLGASAMTPDLSNTLALCQLLGNPQHKFKSVHVGGTNGKGSTSHMLAAVLQTAGYKTGLFTSPHLRDFRERIRVNGKPISEQTVIDFTDQHQKDLEDLSPSFFEVTVAMAFDVFAKEQVDIAIVEVGLGGRLDSTNVISPLLSVITNIGWDHMNILGDTLPKIAAEKAGIIKPGIPVVIGEYQPEVANVFIDKSHQARTKLTFASTEWEVTESKALQPKWQSTALKDIHITHTSQRFPKTLSLQMDLTGSYQQKNLKTALAAIEELTLQGFEVSDDDIKTALKQVMKATGLAGRWDTIGHDPLTICDTGHNPEGIAEVLKNIRFVSFTHLHFILGMVNDKDIGKVLAMLPDDATYYFCKPGIPRGLDEEDLKNRAGDYGLMGGSYPSVMSALIAARFAAGKDDLIFIGGSTFVVAEVV